MVKIPVRHISIPLKEPDTSKSFSIRSIEALLSGKDMVQELHRHSFFYILVLEKGQGEHHIDFTSYPISDYTIFFMRPGQVHRLLLSNGSKGFVIQFTKDFYAPLETTAHQVLRRASSKNHCRIDSDRFKKISSTLATIFEEYSTRQERYSEVIRASLYIFFIDLLRVAKNPETSLSADSEYRQQRLEELQELIEQHASSNKQVTFYAEKLRLTPYQLNAITKTMLDKTCSEVIDEYLILEAKRQLLATSNQVNQIGWDLGFEDPSYFIRFFRKHTGQSPEAFRSNFR